MTLYDFDVESSLGIYQRQGELWVDSTPNAAYPVRTLPSHLHRQNIRVGPAHPKQIVVNLIQASARITNPR